MSDKVQRPDLEGIRALGVEKIMQWSRLNGKSATAVDEWPAELRALHRLLAYIEYQDHALQAERERVRDLESAIMSLGMYDPKMAGGSRLVNGKTWLSVWALLEAQERGGVDDRTSETAQDGR